MALKRIITQEKDLQLIQDNVESELIPLQNQPMNGGSVLKNIFLTAAQDNLVQHNLNRVPQYFILLFLNANTAIWTQASPSISGNTNANSSVINLRCTASCTVSLWIN